MKILEGMEVIGITYSQKTSLANIIEIMHHQAKVILTSTVPQLF